MIRNEEILEDSTLPILTHPEAEARGQVQFCQNSIINLFEKRDSPSTKEFPDVKIKRQLIDYYLRGISSLTSQYGIYTEEFSSPNAFHDKYLIQTDDVDIEYSKFLQNTLKKYNIKTDKKQVH